MRVPFALAVAICLAILTGSAAMVPSTLQKAYTEHVNQLTNGASDRPNRIRGITGTDLGSSFQSGDNLYLLFGDSWTVDPTRRDQDSVAKLVPFPPGKDQRQPILWIQGTDGFEPIQLPGVDLGGMNVPVEGVFANGANYIFFQTDFNGKRHLTSTLAKTPSADMDVAGLQLVGQFPTRRFINVSILDHDGYLWIFGSGYYRATAVYLARVRPVDLEYRQRWEYFAGVSSSGEAQYSNDEEQAQALTNDWCVGELSVRKHPELGWLMLYNCDRPLKTDGGILLSKATQPWGPWEEPITIFHGWTDQGYTHFMHARLRTEDETVFDGVPYDDGLAEPGAHVIEHCTETCDPKAAPRDCESPYGWRERCWGGAYGPYMVPRWFESDGKGAFTIYYFLSTWAPYQVHLMRTVLNWKGAPALSLPPRPGANQPVPALANGRFESGDASGWVADGDPFVVYQLPDGRHRVTTFAPSKGDAATGRLSQTFTLDDKTKSLSFWVHGGDGVVKLIRPGEEVVRVTRGRSGFQPRNSPENFVCWNLQLFAGETLRLAIEDQVQGAWGFVGAGDFRFSTRNCADIASHALPAIQYDRIRQETFNKGAPR